MQKYIDASLATRRASWDLQALPTQRNTQSLLSYPWCKYIAFPGGKKLSNASLPLFIRPRSPVGFAQLEQLLPWPKKLARSKNPAIAVQNAASPFPIIHEPLPSRFIRDHWESWFI